MLRLQRGLQWHNNHAKLRENRTSASEDKETDTSNILIWGMKIRIKSHAWTTSYIFRHLRGKRDFIITFSTCLSYYNDAHLALALVHKNTDQVGPSNRCSACRVFKWGSYFKDTYESCNDNIGQSNSSFHKTWSRRCRRFQNVFRRCLRFTGCFWHLAFRQNEMAFKFFEVSSLRATLPSATEK